MFLVLGGRTVHENGVWDGRRSEAEEMIGVLMDLDRKRWRGSERVLRARRGTRKVLALKALSLLGVTAIVSCVPRQGKGLRTQGDLGGAESLQDGHGAAALGTGPGRSRRRGGGGNLPVPWRGWLSRGRIGRRSQELETEG